MLTPKEAFEHIKALWPNTTSIENCGGVEVRIKHEGIADYQMIQIDWNGIKEYPPHPEKWRIAVPSDIQFPPKKARFSNNIFAWSDGYLCGCNVINKQWKWHKCGSFGDVIAYNYCEVKDDK